MKISIGFKQISGPFGGGNQFLQNLEKFLKENGHTVINHLRDLDIDIILITNPLIDSETSTYNNFDVDNYIRFKNPSALVFQRINECDERKGTNFINTKINKFNRNVDINIFVSSWLKNLFLDYEIGRKKNHVILGGPDELIFNNKDKIKWNKEEKIKLVTHHWSNNWLKGFDEYCYIDSLLSDPENQKKFQFTYIGNIPKNVKFKNTRIIEPISDNELAQELKKHHIYVTASKNEPSGNHHMEAALCGLPILYINSGALPEYCNEFGQEFNKENFIEKLENISKNYDVLFKKLSNYPFTFSNAAKNYLTIFEENLLSKDAIIINRKLQFKFVVKFNYYKNSFIKIIYKKFINFKQFLGTIKKGIK